MLRVEHVTKRFGPLVAVNNLSFHVPQGHVFGIAGPNGAGKSTIYNLVTGFYPYEGKIFFSGRNLNGLAPHRIARLGLARTFQVPRTFPSLTVEQNVTVGNRFGSPETFDPGHVDKVIAFVGLETERRRPAGGLNLLERKKLMIAAALATKPRMLMLDEPMAGSNTREIRSLMDLIHRINGDLGVTIVIIEHFMKVLTDLADTLLIIESGMRICSGHPEQVTRDPRVIQSYLGDAYASDHRS